MLKQKREKQKQKKIRRKDIFTYLIYDLRQYTLDEQGGYYQNKATYKNWNLLYHFDA